MKTAARGGIILTVLIAALPALAQVPTPAPAQPAAPAPAAAPAPEAKPDWMNYKNPYVGEENDLANPHRTTDEISAWAQQAATDTLSFNPTNYRDKLTSFKKYFAPQGWQLYADYLKSSNVMSSVTNDGFSVGAIADGKPDIVNSGAVDGTYHWIVKLPLTVSFFTTASDGTITPGTMSKYTLFIDMARIADQSGEGIAINNWRMDPAAAQ